MIAKILAFKPSSLYQNEESGIHFDPWLNSKDEYPKTSHKFQELSPSNSCCWALLRNSIPPNFIENRGGHKITISSTTTPFTYQLFKKLVIYFKVITLTVDKTLGHNSPLDFDRLLLTNIGKYLTTWLEVTEQIQ